MQFNSLSDYCTKVFPDELGPDLYMASIPDTADFSFETDCSMQRPILLSILLLSGLIQSCKLKPAETPVSKPNILIIVADDLGFNDVGAYGGNVNTPVIDRLAEEGVLFTNFHVLPTCSPSRSSLLTGNDNHVAGIGIMSEMAYPALTKLNLHGYTGYLSNQVLTIPELLQEEYHTYMVGKWHLGEGPGKDPHDRGFEKTFILGTGGGSHWSDAKPLAPPQRMEYTSNGRIMELPSDFYSTRNYTDTLISYIASSRADGKPFMAYLSYTAVHDPLHAPKEYIDKYTGKFDDGWDQLWEERVSRMKELGILPENVDFALDTTFPKWDSFTPEQQLDLARDMEVYAAMLDYMDMSIGRVLDFLKDTGEYENTLIFFLSDNGPNGAMATTYPGNEDGAYLSKFNNSIDNRGLIDSYIATGPGWAQASAAPLKYFKTFTSEGGIRVPLIVKMPGNPSPRWSKSLVHITDIMPTILEITGISYPEEFNGNQIHPLIGKSMLPYLQGKADDIRGNTGIGYELFEMKAYIEGQWKILRLPFPLGSGEWELFNLEDDPGEQNDLSEIHPDIKERLIMKWNEYAIENSVHDHNGHYDSLYRASY